MRRCDRKSYALERGVFATALMMLACIAARAGAQPEPSAVAVVAPVQRDARQACTGATAVPDAAGVINLNTASLEQLTMLPGIGTVRALAVLELRSRLQRFTRLEQLMRVRGVGRKTFRRLLPMLRLEGETTLTARSRSRCPTTQAVGTAAGRR